MGCSKPAPEILCQDYGVLEEVVGFELRHADVHADEDRPVSRSGSGNSGGKLVRRSHIAPGRPSTGGGAAG
jgi:hypothetical protein